jgi:uncharacterized protein YegP (UPF0339 family)
LTQVNPDQAMEGIVAYKFVISKDKKGEFRVNFKYNAETVFATEGYVSKASAKNAIESIVKNGAGAEIIDES